MNFMLVIEECRETVPHNNNACKLISINRRCFFSAAAFFWGEKRYYGINVLADVLRGANSKRITDAELNKLPEYGKLKRVRRDDLITTIEWLIENHFILKTKHPTYPVLHPTYEGMHYNETITANKLKKLQSILLER